MIWHLFLDDTRDPRVFPTYSPALPRRPKDHQPLVLWAVNNDQAIAYLDAYGPPKVMYLDHDLGPVETAMDFLKYAQEKYPNNPPETVHYLTANPVGEQNMFSFIASWRKTAEPAQE